MTAISPVNPNPVPVSPAGLDPVAVTAWDGFWRSGISQIVDRDADMPAIERWAYCVSERAKLTQLVSAAPLVRGSVGNSVANPLYSIIEKLTREIHRYEDHFGMTSLSRMRLGITYADAHDALNDLMSMPNVPLVTYTDAD